MSSRQLDRVGFVPTGPMSSASSRLQVYLPHRWLAEHEPERWFILRHPKRHRRSLGPVEAIRIFADVVRHGIGTVIFQKVHRGSTPLLMALLRKSGRRVIYVEADERRKVKFARQVDAIVAPSTRLAANLAERTGKPVATIPDPLEYHDPAALQRPWTPKPRYRTLWIGASSNWHQLQSLKAMLAAANIELFELVTVSDHPEADIRWSLETVREQLATADLGIIPLTRDSRSTMKSHNRATLFMALGIPVIIGGGDVYKGLVRDGETGFVYESADELKALSPRLQDANLVQSVRQQAMEAAEAYSIDRIAPLWRAVADGSALSATKQES